MSEYILLKPFRNVSHLKKQKVAATMVPLPTPHRRSLVGSLLAALSPSGCESASHWSWLIVKKWEKMWKNTGKIEGKKRRGWQRVRWLGGIINSMDINFSKFWEMVEGREAWRAAVRGVAKRWTQPSGWTTTTASHIKGSCQRCAWEIPGSSRAGKIESELPCCCHSKEDNEHACFLQAAEDRPC